MALVIKIHYLSPTYGFVHPAQKYICIHCIHCLKNWLSSVVLLVIYKGKVLLSDNHRWLLSFFRFHIKSEKNTAGYAASHVAYGRTGEIIKMAKRITWVGAVPRKSSMNAIKTKCHRRTNRLKRHAAMMNSDRNSVLTYDSYYHC